MAKPPAYNWHLQCCTRALEQAGVIAYPTEAVWGLGCDPFNKEAVESLLALKRRPLKKGLILVAADMMQIEPLLSNLSATQRQTLAASWPGPVTWLIPDPLNLIPAWVKGQHQSIAVRVSDHPIVANLCRSFSGPIVSTSANPTNAEPARSLLRTQLYFGSGLDAIMPGSLGGLDKPTEIRDLASSKAIRS